MLNISEIVNECLYNFLNEELSISSDVENYVNDIIDGLVSLNKNDGFSFFKEYTMLDGNNRELCKYREKVFWVKGEIYNGISLPCRITVLDFDSEDDAYNFCENASEWNNNHFDQSSLDISVVVNGVNGAINMLLLKNLVYHEAEHAYQYFRKFGSLCGDKSIYSKAKAIVQGKDKIHNSNEFGLIAHLLYYLNSREIDSNVNGLYGELLLTNNIQVTNFNQEYETMKNEFKQFLETCKTYDFNKELSYFGFNINSFVRFINNQQKYLRKKIRKVVARTTVNETRKVEHKNKIKSIYI